MLCIERLKRLRRSVSHRIKNSLKRAQLFPFGFRAQPSVAIAWSVSANGGGGGGRIFIGNNSVLDNGVILRANGGTILIGENSSVGPYCMIHGGGGIKIGNGVRIGSHAVVVAADHIFDDPTKFIFLQGESMKGISIADDVWIGAGAKILDGVFLAVGTVVAAGAVVTNSTDPYSVVAGVPARRIKFRTK